MEGGRWGRRRSRRGSVEDEDGGEGLVAIMIRDGVKNICTGAECSLVAQRVVRSPHAVTRPKGTKHHSTRAERRGLRAQQALSCGSARGLFSNLYLRSLFGCSVSPRCLHSPKITWESSVFSRRSSERLCPSSLQHSVLATFVHRRSIRPLNEIYTSKCLTFVSST